MWVRGWKPGLAGRVWVCASLLVACGRITASPAPEATQVTHAASATPALSNGSATEGSPTFTPEPLAASVNGEAVSLAAYEHEVRRCQAGQASLGLDPANCPAAALQSLIEQKAAEQAALAAGLAVSDDELAAALAKITADLGSAEAYQAWLAANLYTDDEFRQALRRDLLRARMAAQVTAQIGDTAEQVHARELLVADEATARSLLAQLKGGADFATLALTYSLDLSSRPAGGDLGWFPRGLLSVPEVEQAAFALQPGGTSDVIHSALGYHIVQTLERDPERPLSPGAEQALRARAYQDWLDHVLAEAVIHKFLNP